MSRRPIVAWRNVAPGLKLLVGLVGLVGLLAPAASYGHADPHPPLPYRVVGPAQEERVASLLRPWVDGGDAAAGMRWDGAEIAGDRVCYRFVAAVGAAGGPKRRLCLFAAEHPEVAAARAAGVAVWALPGGAALVGDGVLGDKRRTARAASDAAPRPDDDPLFAAMAARLAANAEAAGLAALWYKPAREEVMAVRLVRPDDALIWAPIFALWLLISAARAGRRLPGGGWPFVLALLTAAAALRWTLPVQAPMTAWSWSRLTTLASALKDSDALYLWLWPRGGVSLDDAQAQAMRLCSTLTPIALFGHGCKLFGAPRPALLAALLLVFSPHALRFAAADDQFTVSMLWSSSAFLYLYQALALRSAWARALALPPLVALCWLTLTAQPLNLVFAPLMVSAIFLAAQRDALAWRLTLAVIIVAVAAVVFAGLLDSNLPGVEAALGAHSLQGALYLLLSPSHNPLLFTRLTPPALTALLVVGAVAVLWRPRALVAAQAESSAAPADAAARFPARDVARDAAGNAAGDATGDAVDAVAAQTLRRRGLWLIAWTFGFIALHGVVVVDEPMNNARYQLHSLPAMALLGGLGLHALLGATAALGPRATPGRRRALRGGVALALVAPVIAAPWLHAEAIGDVDFDVMRERAFVERLRADPLRPGPALVPDGCHVVEIARPRGGPPASKWDRVGWQLGAEPARRWRRLAVQQREVDAEEGGPVGGASAARSAASAGVDASVAQAAIRQVLRDARIDVGDHDVEADAAGSQLSARGRTALAQRYGCLVFYEGLDCRMGPGDDRRHPVCAEVLATGRWQLIAEERFVARVYDQGISRHLAANGDAVALRAWRRVGP